jgi:hypothetical protein
MVWRTITYPALEPSFISSVTTSFLRAGKTVPLTRPSATVATRGGCQKPDLERGGSAGVSCESRLLTRISSVPLAIFDIAPLI